MMARSMFGMVMGALAVPATCAAAWLLAPATAQPAADPGREIYNTRCAACHDNADATRSPSKAALAALPPADIDYALTEGKMQAQGAGLTIAERRQLIRYLTGAPLVAARGVKDDWSANMMCVGPRATAKTAGPAPVTTFGFDRRNTRSLTAAQAGLTKAQLSNMELAWAIAFPGATMMRAQPAIVGNTVFLPVVDARAVYAFDVSDAAKPCVKWVFRTSSSAPLRSSAAYGVLADGSKVLAFTGFDGMLYLLDADTGKAIWTKRISRYKYNQATSTPVILKDRIVVPMSQYEIVLGSSNDYQCCTHHGYVVSLDPKTGAQQWSYETMEDAKPIRDRGDGKFLYGPSGAPIWTSPAIDEKRGLFYVGTGEANSEPVHKNTDAMIAIGLADGKERWSYQATDRDIYNIGCGIKPKPEQLNCSPNTVYRDVDFGASMILGDVGGGRDLMFGGQKSGTVWALDPPTGKLIWRTDLGSGGPLGGIHWGIAYDKNTVYAPISAVGSAYTAWLATAPAGTVPIKSGLYALDATTGKIKWSFATQADCTGDRVTRVPACARAIGLSAAPSVIDGAVVQGGLDGRLYILDGADGRLLWSFDTAIAYQGINGVAGKGGAIDGPSIAAANGLLFVNSGYAMFGQVPGNVFLAFRPKTK